MTVDRAPIVAKPADHCVARTDIGSWWTHCPPPNCEPYYSAEHFASDLVIDRPNPFHEIVSGVFVFWLELPSSRQCHI